MAQKNRQSTNGNLDRWVIIRTRDAGCFFGRIVSRNADTVVLSEARRLWYWAGAASLSQLAMEGTSDPSNCKFPQATATHELLGVIEIIDTTEKAQASIKGVKEWRA